YLVAFMFCHLLGDNYEAVIYSTENRFTPSVHLRGNSGYRGFQLEDIQFNPLGFNVNQLGDKLSFLELKSPRFCADRREHETGGFPSSLD
ncbi:hypothetical protein, partial [Xylella fastidiosa]|uniref:hypothetical protein n=1 Tax=Xylella fastidiosa TaxID=2371 RepID=UPI000570BA51